MDESLQRKQDVIVKEKTEDQDRLKRLVLDSDEEAKRRLQEKNEYMDAQNLFKEYREKVKEGEKVGERLKHEDYIRQCQENEKLQIAKEKMYKQFFQNFDQNMN